MAALRELGGRSGKQRLRNQLDWDEDRYTQVKESLVEAGRVIPGLDSRSRFQVQIPGPGRGGSLILAEEV